MFLISLVFGQIKPLSVRYGTSLSGSDHDMEGRIVTAEFDSFYLINTYVPNSGDGLKRLVLLKFIAFGFCGQFSFNFNEWIPWFSSHTGSKNGIEPSAITSKYETFYWNFFIFCMCLYTSLMNPFASTGAGEI